VTRSGDITPDAAVFHDASLSVVVVTSVEGQSNLAVSALPNVSVITAGERDVDIPQALGRLRDEFGVRTLLCEGGPRVYGAFISSEALDEEFLTLSPVLVGGSAEQQRPGLIEGLALAPGSPQRACIVSVRRASDHLFLRTTLDYGH
jgi:riboflavin biosynthesis pyrimidine reductase